MRIATLFGIYTFAEATTRYDEKTVLSTMSNGMFIDVRTLPNHLREAGIPLDAQMMKMADFLDEATVKTLNNVRVQVVHTSPDSVTHEELCKYLDDVSRLLPHIDDIDCGPNEATESLWLDPELDVNDAGAWCQDHLKRMRMGEVWEMAKPYMRSDPVRVAVIDSAVDFSDPDLYPVRGTFYKKDGTPFYGTWNFVDDTHVLGNDTFHGTACAKALASKGNNTVGITGVAPNHVKLASLQSMQDLRGSWVATVEALDFASSRDGVSETGTAPSPKALALVAYNFPGAMQLTMNPTDVVETKMGPANPFHHMRDTIPSYLKPAPRCEALLNVIMTNSPEGYEAGVEGFINFLQDTHDARRDIVAELMKSS
ncbi:Suppressor of the cold-sensitive snRNP bioproteinsis mutant brr1-1 [Perkinsus olseni]|uniref:subtilisin n=1 Tax=Perkinsus olseni TaxID=32597 RepID=A0A7J6MM16_PEROL|nr:Suppressor of the cold-sensitive snRNP bioproteinsis mutant brr1-1 [Perkinsus olseni]